MTPKDDENDGPDQGIIASQEADKESKARAESTAALGAKACSLCLVTFDTVEDQRSHIKSDLHGYNLKQRMRGANAVTEGEFEKLFESTVTIQGNL